MKKVLFVCAVIFSLQSVKAQKVTYGVKGGFNFASHVINYESPIDYKYKLGFQIGGFAKIELVERLYLQLELMYSLQGTKYDVGNLSLNLPQTEPGNDPLFKDNVENMVNNESTVILPVMLKYYFTNTFNVEIGPQLDYIFFINQDSIDYDEGDKNITEEIGSTSDFNFGVNLGVGYDFNENLGLGLRYNYGFNQYHGVITNLTNSKLRNSVFQLSFEYRFN